MKLNNITMKDIAKYTGVSTATVSRVLNDNYPVNIETKEKVWKAIKELNYQPNLVAKNLRSKTSNLVAIIVADIKNPYYVSIAKEIDDSLFNEGYNLITCSTDESIEKEKEITNLLLSKQIDAIAISPSDSEKTDLSEFINRDIPIVLVDRKLANNTIPFVGTKNFKESYTLTEYLIKKGHKNIGIITGTLNNSTGLDRLNGFINAMEDYGLNIQEHWKFNGGFEEKQTYEVLKQHMSVNQALPTAIVSCNNLMTKGAMVAFKEKEIRIPEDVSIVSFGGLANQEFFNPQVTCLEQDTSFIGRKVSELLLSQLQHNKQIENIITDSEFIEGNSVKDLT